MPITTAAAETVLLACPGCHGRARFPLSRLTDEPKCPRCKSGLLGGRPFALDRASFTAHTEHVEWPLLVDFWAPWCGPCQAMTPVLERAAQRWRSRLHIAKVNTDEQQTLAGQFAIRSIPTLILYRGREIARHSGLIDGAELDRWLTVTLAT